MAEADAVMDDFGDVSVGGGVVNGGEGDVGLLCVGDGVA